MIKTDDEYTHSVNAVADREKIWEKQRLRLQKKGFSPEEISSLLAPSRSFVQNILDEIAEYEALKSPILQGEWPSPNSACTIIVPLAP